MNFEFDPNGINTRLAAQAEALNNSGMDQAAMLMRAAIIEIDRLCKQKSWQPISTYPKDKMFIWGRPDGPRKYSVGLAYQTVSGTWRDTYGDPFARYATLWYPMPELPGSTP